VIFGNSAVMIKAQGIYPSLRRQRTDIHSVEEGERKRKGIIGRSEFTKIWDGFLKEMVKRPINHSASFPLRETVARCSDPWTSLGVSLFFHMSVLFCLCVFISQF
jgi:hypothetical protein